MEDKKFWIRPGWKRVKEFHRFRIIYLHIVHVRRADVQFMPRRRQDDPARTHTNGDSFDHFERVGVDHSDRVAFFVRNKGAACV